MINRINFELFEKLAQSVSDVNVVIEPMESLIQEAVKRIRAKESNYFQGVSKIVAGSSSGYGHVSSEDPSVIHIDLQKIKNFLSSKISGLGQKEKDEVIINSIIETITHERGHVKDFKPGTGFQGGEGVAEQESKRMLEKFKSS